MCRHLINYIIKATVPTWEQTNLVPPALLCKEKEI